MTGELSTFLSYSTSQRAVSLIISRSRKQTVIALEAQGFGNLQNPHALTTSGKRYADVTVDNAKELYDLALQYATGQITFYDQHLNKTTWINPKYPGSVLVFLVDPAELIRIEQELGLPLRAVTGLTLQTF